MYNTKDSRITALAKKAGRERKGAASMHTATGTERDIAAYYFHEGTSTHAYDFLGAHRIGEQVVFRVFAPHAESVSVCGDFTNWNPELLFMRRITDCGVWEITVRGDWIVDGQRYKYVIHNGCHELYRADPYAVQAESDGTASVIASLDGYEWRDGAWLAWRRGKFDRTGVYRRPINIYQLHAGSWRRHADGSPYSYEELGRELASYAKQMGYTHVALTAEQPFGDCQATGYFAPSSRHGTPHGLMAFVDTMHEAGIGVLLDWGSTYLARDEHGPRAFDGEPLYESAWGADHLDLSRREVQSLLLSSAVFWIESYHVDGLCVDTASMLASNGQGEAVAFLRRLNSYLAKEYPDVITVATAPTGCDMTDGRNGLGFTVTYDTSPTQGAISYLEKGLGEQNAYHTALTQSLTEPSRERTVLPLCGPRSLIDRCAGDWRMQFAKTRLFLAYRMTHPGKKLTFMGHEFGQFRDWNPARELDWFLLDYDTHAALQLYTAELNQLYLEQPALWRSDGEPEGTAILDTAHAAEGIVSFCRRDERGDELTVVLNFSPERREEYLLRVSRKGFYEEILSSDRARYGGSGYTNPGRRHTEEIHRGGEVFFAVHLSLPPMGAVILRRARNTKSKSPTRR